MINAAAQAPKHILEIVHGVLYVFLQIRLTSEITANTIAAINTKTIEKTSHSISIYPPFAVLIYMLIVIIV